MEGCFDAKGSSRRGGGVGARTWAFVAAVEGRGGPFLAGCATEAVSKSSSSASVSD